LALMQSWPVLPNQARTAAAAADGTLGAPTARWTSPRAGAESRS
jgi:hypothetical protein